MQRAEAKMLELHDQMARVHEVCVAALHLALTMVAACSCHILVCCPMYVQCDKADVAVFAGRTLWTCFPRSRRSFPAKRSLENARERPTRALKLLCTINLKSSPQCSPTPTRAGHRRAGAGVGPGGGGGGGGGGGAGGSGQTHVAEVSRARSPNKIQQGAAVAGLRPHEGRNLVAHSMPDSTNRRPTDTLANGPVRPALQRGPSPNKIRRRSRSPPRKTEAASDSILPAAVAPAVTPAQLLSEAPAGNDGAGLAGEDTSALSEGPAATPVGRAVACGEEGGGGGYDGDEIQVSDCVLIRGFASACVRACVRARVRLSVSG
jgi:hypothetical protein